MSKKNKVVPFTPFFYEVQAHNLVIGTIAEIDFASDGGEILEVIARMREEYPIPAYVCVVKPCKRVGK